MFTIITQFPFSEVSLTKRCNKTQGKSVAIQTAVSVWTCRAKLASKPRVSNGSTKVSLVFSSNNPYTSASV